MLLIHLPGGIQPHGYLIAFDREDETATHFSENFSELFNFNAAEIILGRRVSDLLQVELTAWSDVPLKKLKDISPARLKFLEAFCEGEFDCVVNDAGDFILLEFFPVKENDHDRTFATTSAARRAVQKLKDAETLDQMFNELVSEISRISGFDRVVTYRFDAKWNGEVIAEAKTEQVMSLFGRHFPASDIPKQARELYTKCHIRLVPDSNYKKVNLICSAERAKNPLDLTMSLLRSVSPVHVEYLKNMRSRASMSISILKDGILWGLISCQHESGTRPLDYETIQTCEFLGEISSSLLKAKLELVDSDYRANLKSNQATLLQLISQTPNFVSALSQYSEYLLATAGAQGAAICLNGDVVTVGHTPSQRQVGDLADWLSKQDFVNEIFSTDQLPHLWKHAEDFKATGCGIVAISLSSNRNSFIIWFKPEVIQTISWGGDPRKDTDWLPDGTARIHPRKSFELWKETVKGQSLPWKAVELEAVGHFKKSLLDLIIQRAEEINLLNTELKRSNIELDAFAYAASHDLKEPLRGIHNFTHLALKELGADQLIATNRLKTVMKLTQRMEKLINSLLEYSQVGRLELKLKDVDLNKIVNESIEVTKPRAEERNANIHKEGIFPTIQCDPVLIGEAFTNLISNAIKYNDKEYPDLQITCEEKSDRINVHFKDNGIGIREVNLELIFRIFKRLHNSDDFGGGSGTGLTICKGIIERHHGQIRVESELGIGSTFIVTLPKNGRSS